MAKYEQFWIEGTNPDMTKDDVQKTLTLCAKNLNVDCFTFNDIYCLTKFDNSWSKSWKVTVLGQLAEMMMNNAMYLKGWSHRKFSQLYQKPAKSVTGLQANLHPYYQE